MDSMLKNRFKALATALLTAALAVACVTNPVTGEQTLQFYDEEWEKQVGQQMYVPMRQSQGGDYVVDPGLSEYVNRVGQRIAQHARRDATLDFEFEVVNNGVPNAWALPGGKIALNRGLLVELDNEAELAAVLAHEIVHADAAHSAQQQSKGMLTQIGALAGMVVLGSQAESRAGQQAAVLLPQLGAQLVTQKYSRDAERESDRYGMQYMSEAGYDPQGAVTLQETFVRLAENRRQDWLSGLFASHPPSQERVARNREIAESLPSGGELGRERYQRAIATLKSDQPAYDAYQEAGQALADENTRDARRLVRRAIELEPREPLFHVLAGDIASAEEDQREAYGHYDRAVDLYPDLFYSRMQRGEILYDRGDRAAAQRDLEHSVKLLPTAKAHYLLGNIARDGGRRDDARQHYGVAAQSDSRYGQAARAELQRLGS